MMASKWTHISKSWGSPFLLNPHCRVAQLRAIARSRADAAWLLQQVIGSLEAVAWVSANTLWGKALHERSPVILSSSRYEDSELATWRGLPSQGPVLSATPVEAPRMGLKKPSWRPSPDGSSDDPSPGFHLTTTKPQVRTAQQLKAVNPQTVLGLKSKRPIGHKPSHLQEALCEDAHTRQWSDGTEPRKNEPHSRLVPLPRDAVILPIE